MKCKEFHNDLPDYLEGKLVDEDRQAMEKHAGQCLSCAVLPGWFNALDQAIAFEKTLEPNPFSHTRILKKLEDIKPHRSTSGSVLVRPVLLTLGLIAAMTAGFFIGNSGSLRKSQTSLESGNIEQLRSSLFVQDFADEDITLIDKD
jgi:hypothetical protein